jgi:hypothetical protein
VLCTVHGEGLLAAVRTSSRRGRHSTRRCPAAPPDRRLGPCLGPLSRALPAHVRTPLRERSSTNRGEPLRRRGWRAVSRRIRSRQARRQGDRPRGRSHYYFGRGARQRARPEAVAPRGATVVPLFTLMRGNFSFLDCIACYVLPPSALPRSASLRGAWDCSRCVNTDTSGRARDRPMRALVQNARPGR